MNLNLLREKLQEKGVVGLGGGGFPSFLKLRENLHTFIINGAECEPLLKSDFFYIKNNLPKIISTAKLFRKHLKIKRIVFAIKKKNLKIIDSELLGKNKIEIFPLKDSYPVGDERIIIKLLDNKLIPHEKYPGDYGYIVHNVETCGAIFDAVEGDIPLTKRYITICGEVKNSFVAEVKIGTPIKKLIETAGGYTCEDPVILESGVMMGKIVSEDDFIKKQTSALIVLPMDNRAVLERLRDISHTVKKSFESCCSCEMCTMLCSRKNIGYYLRPDRILKGNLKFYDTSIFNCSGCGICSLYACPFDLSPRKIIDFLKKKSKGAVERNFPENAFGGENLLIPSENLKKKLNITKYETQIEFMKINDFSTKYEVYLPPGTRWLYEKGKKVKEGDKLNEIVEKYGNLIHSPISGTISLVDGNKLKIKR